MGILVNCVTPAAAKTEIFDQMTEQHINYMLAKIPMKDRKSTRLNSSHTEIYTLSLHDALPIYGHFGELRHAGGGENRDLRSDDRAAHQLHAREDSDERSEEHTSELQSHRDLHSFPTRRSSDLWAFW